MPGFDFKTHVKLSTGKFSFQEVDTDLILKIVQSLKNRTSSGIDGISNVMLKTIAPYTLSLCSQYLIGLLKMVLYQTA